MHDMLTNVPELKIGIHNEGFVRLVDCMPRISETYTTADFAVVEAAKASLGFDDMTLTETEIRKLLRYMARKQHSSPTEMVRFKFHIRAPIFVMRQWIRHRMSSTNEISGRYAVMEDRFYLPEPDKVLLQSPFNKQGGSVPASEEVADAYLEDLQSIIDDSYEKYRQILDSGIAKEQARVLLPLNLYTEWYWLIDLHNLLHFLDVRSDSHAQQEIQDYANVIIRLIQPIVPLRMQAWEDYSPFRGGMLLSAQEVLLIRRWLQGQESSQYDPKDIQKFIPDKREAGEAAEKMKKLLFLPE